jgi:hypothetical protein
MDFNLPTADHTRTTGPVERFDQMNVKLRIQKDGSALYEGTYDICDAESFGRACADAWARLREQKFAKATSIGALYESLEDELLDGLIGAQISLSKTAGP